MIVEAAEDSFVPMCVFNNIEGSDRRVLERFGEPTWNNPVVRVIDANERDVAPRNGRDWTRSGVARSMTAAIEQSGRDVPRYLELLAFEDTARRTGVETAVFGMT